MSPPPAVEVEVLTKLYGARVALDGLSFALPMGSVGGLVGPNGAGKTTALRVLLGLVRPSGGAARVLGHSIAHPERDLARVGALIEGPAFHPALTGRRNLEALAGLGSVDRALVDAALDQVGLAAHEGDRYRSYSLGMKQRLGIAAVLLRQPQLVVLDEPMNGLDPAGIRESRARLRDLAATGITVLVSSHLLAEVQQICDHLMVIRAAGSCSRGRWTNSSRPPGSRRSSRERGSLSTHPAWWGCVPRRATPPASSTAACTLPRPPRGRASSTAGPCVKASR
jgi:ABC-2 type transport system ATP-binding protein